MIVGAGVVGRMSAKRLADEGHDVTLVERDEALARELDEKLDIRVVAGNGCSLQVLRDADLERADLLLAVTDSDEVNMITALIAGSTFKVPTKVVRLRTQEYLDNINELAKNWHGRTFGISPDRVSADRIVSLLDVPHAVDVAEVLSHKLVVAGFRLPPGCPLLGRSLVEIAQQHPNERFLIASIYRAQRAIRPTGATVLQEGDIAYFSVIPEDLPKIRRLLGFSAAREKKVVVGGGGHIGLMVAREAIERGRPTVIIRRNRAEAERLAVELPEALVLSGDVTSEEILLEAGIDHSAVFVAVTNSYEINLLSSLLAKGAGAERVITLVDNPRYIKAAEAMGIHATVSPRLASVGEILKFVRGLHVEEVQSLLSELVEISSVDIDDRSPLAGKPLRELPLPAGVLVAAVLRGGEVVIPGGGDVLQPGSKVVLFTLAENAPDLARIVD